MPIERTDFQREIDVTHPVNGRVHRMQLAARGTLRDTLREDLGLAGTKKGGNFGECRAGTVHPGGGPVNVCLVLAAAAAGCGVRS